MSTDAPHSVPSTDEAGPLPPTLGTSPSLDAASGRIDPSLPRTITSEPPDIPTVTASAPPGYEILGELGRGGMGVVYKAQHVRLERVVALKMILSGDHAGNAEVSRFQTEARAVARLQHPGIVQVFEVGEHAGLPFFSLEFCDGGSLVARLGGNPWAARHAAETLEALARAMQHAHENGIVHRDLKPANVLLARKSKIQNPKSENEDSHSDSDFGFRISDFHPKIADFGLAKRTDADSALSRSGAIMGTPSYMAPEQAMGKHQEIGPAADVYALGAILYELLTGRPPFKGVTVLDTLAQVAAEDPVPPSRLARVPRDLETICLKCLEKEPRRRYASAAALADDLQRFLAGETIVARPAGWLERTLKWTRRRPAAAGLLLVTVVGIAGIVWKYADAEQQRRNAERAEKTAREEADKARRAERAARDEEERANQAEKKALAEADKANHERDRAESLLYAGNLLQAQLFWEAGNMAAARDRLDACRWDYRGWEHAHLRRQLDATCATLRDSTAGGTRVTFSPDGRLLACTSAEGTVRLCDVSTGRDVLTLRGFAACMAFSPDGTRLVSGGVNGSVKVWDASGNREMLSIKGHNIFVRGVCYSPDGSRLATWSLDGTLKVWDAATGQELVVIKGQTLSAAFSPDSKRLAGTSADRTVKLWDVLTGAEVLILKGHVDSVLGVSFSPDGRHLASSSVDRTVKVWDALTGQERLTFKGHTGSVADVASARMASAWPVPATTAQSRCGTLSPAWSCSPSTATPTTSAASPSARTASAWPVTTASCASGTWPMAVRV